MPDRHRRVPSSTVRCHVSSPPRDDHAGPPTPPVRRSRWGASRWWAIGRFVTGILLGGLALYALNGDRDELVGASSLLGRMRLDWLLVAVLAEVVSLLSFATLQRRLLAAGGVRVTLGSMTSISLAALTIASSVPAGPAISSIFVFRQYRRRHADDAHAGWTIISSMVFAALGLALLAAAGVLLAYSESAGYDLIGVVFGVLLLTVVVDAVVWQRRWLARVAIFLLELSRQIFKRPRRHGLEIVEGLLAQLAAVRLSWRDLVAVVATGIGNWLFDCGCLAASFVAVRAPVPWRGLLLAYGAGQLAENLPITPGGLGVVENSLTIALVAFGGAQASTVAAVLLYRIVTFWGYLPIGWIDWAVLHITQRRADHRHAPAQQPAERADAPSRRAARAGVGDAS
jgi:uncharacterized protein (TIRG00374 family)